MENLILTNLTLQELKSHISEAIRQELVVHLKPGVQETEKEEYLTRKQTAKFLGISLPTLSKWTQEGLVPAFRISSRIRYKQSEVELSLQRIKSLKNSRLS